MVPGDGPIVDIDSGASRPTYLLDAGHARNQMSNNICLVQLVLRLHLISQRTFPQHSKLCLTCLTSLRQVRET